ncbi:PKD domain-containing protein [bacterium]|nr:PKD domain-containing protein [bacterium]
MKHAFVLVFLLALLSCLGASCGSGGAGLNLDAPHITAITPLTATANQQVTFVATNVGGPITKYVWRFGGGATPNISTNASPTVTLGAPGTYNCTLEASNGSKGSYATFMLIIQ